jgi:hypothetical protein
VTDHEGPAGEADDAAGRVPNPFLVPGMTANPYQPLRPWDEPEHAGYYVAVDRTGSAFAEFTEKVADPLSLVTYGRLVVVLGGQGCGKTSLVNRCAAWVQTSLADHGVTPMIFDLTRTSRDSQPTPERMSAVCAMIIDQLELDQRLAPPVLAELRSRQRSPDPMYHYLSLALDRLAARGGTPLAAVVLLPPSQELRMEILEYARVVRPRLVFFAESSYLDPQGSWQAGLDRASPAPPIALTVGGLEPEDGWLYAQARLRGHDGGKPVPIVRRETMDRVVRAPGPSLTIEQLLRLLFGVYDEVLARPAPAAEVTFEDITEYYFRHGTGLRGP